MKTIIFDFDGTIANSYKVIIDHFSDLNLSSPQLDKVKIAYLEKKPLSEIASSLHIPKYRWPYLLFRGRRLVSRRINEVKPFEGIDELLIYLHSSGYRLIVLSRNRRMNIKKFLTNNNLDSKVDEIYGGSWLLGKSRALKKIMKRDDLKANDIVYIGDETMDVVAAKNNNIAIIAVSWGYNSISILEKSQPTKIVNKPNEILSFLKNMRV